MLFLQFIIDVNCVYINADVKYIYNYITVILLFSLLKIIIKECIKMLDELNDYLYEYGFDTQLDSDGIYIPEYNIDIIIEDSIYIIRPFDSDTVTAYSIEEAINYIRDFSYSLEFSKEMEKNNYSYEKNLLYIFLLVMIKSR